MIKSDQSSADTVWIASDPKLLQADCKESDQIPVVHSIVSLTCLLMTNSLSIVAKVFSYTLMFLLLTFFSKKNMNVFAIFQDRNLNVTLAYNFVKFWTTGSRCVSWYESVQDTCVMTSLLVQNLIYCINVSIQTTYLFTILVLKFEHPLTTCWCV